MMQIYQCFVPAKAVKDKRKLWTQRLNPDFQIKIEPQ